MSCPKNRNDLSKKPKLTDTMRSKDQIYVWTMIKNNPNLYCWVPKSKKDFEQKGIPLDKVKVMDIPPPPVKKSALENTEVIATRARNRYLRKNLKEGKDVVSYDDPEKYKIVKKFIQEKGLIIYGGMAINASLPKEAKIYKPTAIPDYDVFSMDPWNDAVELANKLHNAGYVYSEVRGGIHKGTYKVFSNMWPVADITYLPPKEFNELQTKKKGGITMIGDAKIMADIFRQLTSVNDLYRWDKTYNREKLYLKWNQPLGKRYKCSKDIFLGGKQTISDQRLVLLQEAQQFLHKKKRMHVGPVAYNTYIQIGGGDQRILVDHYEVMSPNAQEDADELVTNLAKLSNQNTINLSQININIRHQTAKPGNNFSYIITYSGEPICIITQLTNCIGYKYLDGKYIAGIDFVKWLMYTDLAFANVSEASDLKCKIKYLTEIQNNYYKKKKITDLDESPFQRLISKCDGPLDESVKTIFFKKWMDRIENRSEIRAIKPTEDTVTLHNVKGATIRIFPKTNKDSECLSKNKEDCKYPCNWNDEVKKCFPVPEGIYRVGDPNIEPLEELPTGNDGLYPSYGDGLYPSYG